MFLKGLLAACVLILGICATAAYGQRAVDPISGTWTGRWGPTPIHRHNVTVELKWNGKTLKGTLNPGPNAIKLQRTSFDPITGAVHLEADAGSMGHRFHYIIDGTVENGILFGNWYRADLKGDFKLTKK